MVRALRVADDAAMTHYCVRCGANSPTWRMTVLDPSDAAQRYDARLCRLCTTHVLQSIESRAPYLQPVNVYLTFEDG